jgi:hypothetical protein
MRARVHDIYAKHRFKGLRFPGRDVETSTTFDGSIRHRTQGCQHSQSICGAHLSGLGGVLDEGAQFAHNPIETPIDPARLHRTGALACPASKRLRLTIDEKRGGAGIDRLSDLGALAQYALIFGR